MASTELPVVQDARVALGQWLANPKIARIRDTLALLAVLKLSKDTLDLLREYGLLGVFHLLYKELRRRFFALLRVMPFVSGKIRSEITKAVKQLEESVLKEQSLHEDETTAHFLALPRRGLQPDTILTHLRRYQSYGDRLKWNGGQISGVVYNGGEQLTSLLKQAMDMFFWSNPLHPEVFPGVRKVEAEIIAMVLDLYNGTKIGAVGMVSMGGTESIMMAVRAHKEWAREAKGITSPHVVMPISAHPAFSKACQYFDIRVTYVDLDPVTLQVDLRKVKSAITPNTIMLVGSSPGYPHGITDDIEQLASIAERRGIGMHVDCCLGGFIVPFLHEAGFTHPIVDFRISGVTSISCDTHKYGFAPKGTSVVMFRTPELRRFAYFTQTDWPGGIYATATAMGSRSGSVLVGCWATLNYFGRSGYVQSTKTIVEKQRRMIKFIKENPHLTLLGNPLGSVFAFSAPKLDVYRISDKMGHRGWGLSACQFPPALHYTVVFQTDVDKFIADLGEIVEAESKLPPQPASGTAAFYGAAATIPDRTLVDSIVRSYCDALYITHLPAKAESATPASSSSSKADGERLKLRSEGASEQEDSESSVRDHE